jgi:hypothetical protein
VQRQLLHFPRYQLHLYTRGGLSAEPPKRFGERAADKIQNSQIKTYDQPDAWMIGRTPTRRNRYTGSIARSGKRRHETRQSNASSGHPCKRVNLSGSVSRPRGISRGRRRRLLRCDEARGNPSAARRRRRRRGEGLTWEEWRSRRKREQSAEEQGRWFAKSQRID